MNYQNKKVKKVVTTLLSTSVILTMTPSAMASSDNPHPPARSAYEQKQQQEATAEVESITVVNGSISVSLTNEPEKPPVLRDFKFTKQINDKKPQSLRVSGFTWDKETKTASFSFTRISSAADKQSVTIGVTYDGSTVEAEPFTVAGRNAEVDKITIVNKSSDAEITVGKRDDNSLRLAAVVLDEDENEISGKRVTWKSDNKKVATVDSSGRVRAVGKGTAEITASIGNVKASFEVKVLAATPTVSSVTATNGFISVTLNNSPNEEPDLDDFTFTGQINRKGSEEIDITDMTWDEESKKASFRFEEIPSTSKDQSVVISVNYRGSIKKAGAFTIAKSGSKVSKVTIYNQAGDERLTVGSEDDESLQLVAIAKDRSGKVISGKSIEWKSEDADIATVSDSGKVMAVAAGETKIIAEADGKSASFKVEVEAGELKPRLSLGTTKLEESRANDGSISGSQIVKLENGKFADNLSSSDVSVNNLPAGLGIEVTRNSDTQITLAFTGKANNHAGADSKNNLSVTIDKSKVVGAWKNVTSGTFGIQFADPVIVPPGPGPVPPTTNVNFQPNGVYQNNYTFTQTGVYGPSTLATAAKVKGNIRIQQGDNVTLQNLEVDGDIIVDSGKDVSLTNVKVTGKIMIDDVASSSFTASNVQSNGMEISDSNGSNIVVEGEGTDFGDITVDSDSEDTELPIIFDGNFGDSKVTVTGNSVVIEVPAGTTLPKIILNKPGVNVFVQGAGRIESLEVPVGMTGTSITFSGSNLQVGNLQADEEVTIDGSVEVIEDVDVPGDNIIGGTVSVSPSYTEQDGSYGTIKFRSIHEALQHVESGSKIRVKPGTYTESLQVNKSVSIIGDTGTGDEKVIIKPSAPSESGYIIDIGEAGTDVHLENITIDGQNGYTPSKDFYGVYFHNGSKGSVKNSTIRNVKPASIGVQNGRAIRTIDADVTIENNTIEEFGKNGVDSNGGTVIVKGNRFIGTDPTSHNTQNSQNGIVFRGSTTGEITGNTFTDFGPSGSENAAYGGARVASDGSIGYAILTQSNIPITGNTFTNVQGIFYDWSDAGVMTAQDILDTSKHNTITGGRYFVEGTLDEGRGIDGQRDDDPNMLNYLLSYVEEGADDVFITIGAGTYDLDKIVTPKSQVTLKGNGGNVTINLPAGSDIPANITMDTGVSVFMPEGWSLHQTNTATVQQVDGYANFQVGSEGSSVAQIRFKGYNGVKLADLTKLTYSTFIAQSDSGQAPYMILNLDNDENGTVDDQIIFEPLYQNGGYNSALPDQGDVALNSWQSWDALAGGWWSVGSLAEAGPGTGIKTLQHYISMFPNARIVTNASNVEGLRIFAGNGVPWANFEGNVANVRIGVKGTDRTFFNVDEGQYNVPTSLAHEASFIDTDLSENSISGDVTWTAAPDESNITHYAVYYLNENGTKGSQIGNDVAKTEPLRVSIPNGTAIPQGATKIGIFSKNANGSSSAATVVSLVDAKQYTGAAAEAFVKPQDFGVMQLSGINGYNVGFQLQTVTASQIKSVEVSLYEEDTLLQTNTSNKLLTAYPDAHQLSSPFDVTKTLTGEIWNFGTWNGTRADVPTKAVIKVTDLNGNTYTVENTNLTGDPNLLLVQVSNDSALFDGDHRITVSFQLSEAIDLSLSSKADVVIRFGTKDGENFTEAQRADGRGPIVKSKLWSGYLNIGSQKYSQGLEGNTSYLNDLPANQLISTVVDSSFPTMSYADSTWFEALQQGNVYVRLEVKDYQGNQITHDIKVTGNSPN